MEFFVMAEHWDVSRELRGKGGKWSKSGAVLERMAKESTQISHSNVVDTVEKWRNQDTPDKIQDDIAKSLSGSDNVSSEARVIAHAMKTKSEAAPMLHRGLGWDAGFYASRQGGAANTKEAADHFMSQLKKGGTIDLPVSSWTTSESVAHGFSHNDEENDYGQVVLHIAPGSRGLDISGVGDSGNFATDEGHENEWLTGGRYEIVSVDKTVFQQPDYHYGASETPKYVVTLRQKEALA